MIAVLIALAVSAVVPSAPALPDSALPYELRRAGGLEHLSADPSRPLEPVGLAFDSFGRPYVTDAALHRLVRFTTDGAVLGETGGLVDDDGGIRRPGAVVAAGVLNMAVLDEERRRILIYDLFGHSQGNGINLDSTLEAAGLGRARPIAMASDRSGNLYIADADGDRVLLIEPSGRLLRELGGPGSSGTGLRGVAGVAVARRGDVFVSERLPRRIARLDPTGALRAVWSLPDSTVSDRLPLAVDDSLHVACADSRHDRVWVFDSSGRRLAVLTGVSGVSALAFGRDGALWVVERGPRRVTRWLLGPRAPRAPGAQP